MAAVPTLRASLAREAFLFLHADAMRSALGPADALAGWEEFAASWDRLELDSHMADGGRYRSRRHAVFSSTPGGEMLRAPHQPHFQSREYNPLNGGVERWFEPIDEGVTRSEVLQSVLRLCRALFEPLRPEVKRWKVEVHQFRIEARADVEGRPTPEGLHRDGVDYVLVLLIRRVNILSGTTTIHDLEHRELGSFTLTEPLDAALVDDARAFHGVTAVHPEDAMKPAFRDVLIVTWKENERC